MSLVPAYILILFLLIGVDFLAGLAIEKASPKKKKFWLLLSIISNLGILFFFKYYNFFLHLVPGSEQYPGLFLNILLPLGLSFHTFQAMSYTIEVYRGNYPAERNILVYSLYVLFYPQLVAGPIERPAHLLPQLQDLKDPESENIKDGLGLMALGFVKKVVIADRIAHLTGPVLNNPAYFQGLELFMALCFFSIQIYCDFSGYSDIALGAARTMNIRLMTNFNRPYLSRSVTEFWKRWHISLSSWFRDYVYIPMGGNRKGPWRRIFNIMLVFALSGFWHGPSWAFLFWGIYHFAGISLEKLMEKIRGTNPTLKKSPLRIFRVIYVFIFVSIGWAFFRSETSQAWLILRKIFMIFQGSLEVHKIRMMISLQEWLYTFAFICMLIFFEWFSENRNFRSSEPIRNSRGALFVTMLLLVIFFGVFNRTSFIYFQF